MTTSSWTQPPRLELQRTDGSQPAQLLESAQPLPELMAQVPLAQPVPIELLAADGSQLGLLPAEQEHRPVVLAAISPLLQQATVDVEDLYSVGLLGLIQALRRFDPTLGVTFASYATMRIRGAVLDDF